MSTGGYEKKDVNIKSLFIISVLPALTLIASIFAVDAYFSYVQIQEEEIKNAEVDSRLVDMKLKNSEALSSFGVADASKGRYRIPLDRAIQLTLNENQRKALPAK